VVGRLDLEPAAIPSPAPPEASLGDRVIARLLRPFGQVDAHEGWNAVVMTLTVFLLLSAYYLLKTAREPLILLEGGAEVKSYASAGQSLLLIVVVRAYSELARRVGRMTLVATVYLFFAANLVLFAALARAEVPIGIAFFLWVGIFNVTAVAQFWSFANDIYDPEQGKRLFGILGIGSSVGAVVGAWGASQLAALGPATLMLVAAVVLVVCVGLFLVVHRRLSSVSTAEGQVASEPVSGNAKISDLLQSRYMLLLAALVLLLNCVNTNGEYLLDRTLLDAVSAQGHDRDAAMAFIGEFKADFFWWVNTVGVLLQLFLVSRIMQFVGVRRALYVLPVVAALSYGIVLVAPILALVKLAKVAENSVNYSLQNTARNALFLVTTRAEKYVGKTIVDTLIVRIGDVVSAGLVFAAARFALPAKALAGLNLVFIVAWMLVLVAIGREHRRRAAAFDAQERAA
jgi:AAA family ATP:ADP antiporter